MKKLLLILFLCLLTFSCERGWLHKILNPEEPQEETPPSVSITLPQANATVSGVVTITAEATANPDRVISNVNFLVDDSLNFSDEASPWEYELNTFEYDNGQISIKVIAYDNYGDSDSATIALILDNVDTTPPSLSIITPVANATVSGLVTIRAEAAANSDRVISNVNFLVDDSLNFSDEASPWEYELNTFEYDNGQISIKVIAYDNYGDSDSATIALILDNYIAWYQTFGGGADDYGRDVQQTTDGGYIVTGYTKSYDGGDLNNCPNSNSLNLYPPCSDIWLIKTDSLGNEEWIQTFGGNSFDEGYSVQQTTDDGYIISGVKFTLVNADHGHYGSEIWLIKTDSDGNEIWSQTFGEDVNYQTRHNGNSVQQTSDGGYIVAGTEFLDIVTYDDIYLIKTNSQGQEEWNRTFDRNGDYDSGNSVQQTSDGGFIIAGTWLIKTDSEGNQEWTNGNINGNSVQQTSDGGFIIAGATRLIKTDSEGNQEWTNGNINGNSVQQTLDGGFIIAGATRLIKTDSEGNQEWTNESINGNSVQQTLDGGFIITGHTSSFGNGGEDVWLIKTDPEGNTVPLDP